MRLNDLVSIQKKILTTIAASKDGEIDVDDLKELYEKPRTDGLRNSYLVRGGLLEWTRRTSSGAARGIRITAAGLVLVDSILEEWPSAE
jgi:hypothetical protein